jgi:cell wall-associated NlpC family hydrolase
MPWWATLQREVTYRDGGRSGCLLDCYGLVCRVYQEQLGIVLKPWDNITLDTLTERGDAVLLQAGFNSPFTAVHSGLEQALDVALIRRVQQVGGKPKRGWWHVGVVTRPGHVLHLERGAGVVEQPFRDTAEARESATLKRQDVQLWRHRSRATAVLHQDIGACA